MSISIWAQLPISFSCRILDPPMAIPFKDQAKTYQYVVDLWLLISFRDLYKWIFCVHFSTMSQHDLQFNISNTKDNLKKPIKQKENENEKKIDSMRKRKMREILR